MPAKPTKRYPNLPLTVSRSGIVLAKSDVNFWFDFSSTAVSGYYRPVYASDGSAIGGAANCKLEGNNANRAAVTGTSLTATNGDNIVGYAGGVLPTWNGSVIMAYEHVVVNQTIADSQTPCTIFGSGLLYEGMALSIRLINGGWGGDSDNLLASYAASAKIAFVYNPSEQTAYFLNGFGILSLHFSSLEPISSTPGFTIHKGCSNLTTGTRMKMFEIINTDRPLTSTEAKRALECLHAKWSIPYLTFAEMPG